MLQSAYQKLAVFKFKNQNVKTQMEAVENIRRIHKTTLLILLLFVIGPWVLVAIPGQADKDRLEAFGDSMNGRLDMVHGWPAVHLTSSKFNMGFPENHSLGTSSGSPEKHLKPRPPEKLFDWAFDHREVHSFQKVPESFWSNVNRWPTRYAYNTSMNDEIRFLSAVAWRGLLINIVFVGGACLVVVWLCERRVRRRGSLFKFTIAESLLVVFAVCCLFAWIRDCNQKSKVSHATISAFQRDVSGAAFLSSGMPEIRPKYRQAIPRVVARLVDNPVSLPFFKSDSVWADCEVQLMFRNLMPQFSQDEFSWEEIATSINKIPLSKTLHAPRFYPLQHVLPLLDNDSISRIVVNLKEKQIPELAVLAPVSDRTFANMSIAIDPSIPFNLSAFERLPKFENFRLSVVFLGHNGVERPEDWQNKYINEIMGLENLSSIVFLMLNENGAEHLLEIPPGDKRVSFHGIPGTETALPKGTKNNRLVDQLIDAGFQHDKVLANEDWPRW